MRESKSMTGIYDLPVLRPPPLSEHAHETGHYPLWNEVKCINQDSHCTGTLVGSRKLST